MMMWVTDKDRRKSSSTSKGDQPKWYKEDYWIKANKFGYEGLSQWTAYNLIKSSTMDRGLITPYEMCNIIEIISQEETEKIGCASKNFLLKGESLITVQRLLETRGIDPEEFLKSNTTTEEKITVVGGTVELITRIKFTSYLRDLLLFDAIILNEDRHLNNIAVIHNKGSDKYRLCPIFDNGLSLLSDTIDYPKNAPATSLIRKVKSKPFSTDFRKQVDLSKTNLRFNREQVLDFMEDNKDILGRVYNIIKIQMNFYPDAFI